MLHILFVVFVGFKFFLGEGVGLIELDRVGAFLLLDLFGTLLIGWFGYLEVRSSV